MKPTFTIGIEEEYQTIDPETRDLRSHIQAEILQKGQLILQERVKAEMHQSVVEVGTGVCKNIKEAKAEVIGCNPSLDDSRFLLEAPGRASQCRSRW